MPLVVPRKPLRFQDPGSIYRILYLHLFVNTFFVILDCFENLVDISMRMHYHVVVVCWVCFLIFLYWIQDFGL